MNHGSTDRHGSCVVGVDLTLQAIPEDWDGLERACSDPKFGGLLTFLPNCLKSLATGTSWRPWPPEDDEREFLNSARILLSRDHEIASRNLSLHRFYDAMLYLLSPSRRNGPRITSDLGSIAIRGSADLGEVARSTVGIRTRWTPSAQVVEVHEFLSSSSAAEFLANYDWGRMDAAAVYKLVLPKSEPAHRETLEKFLEKLRNFYASAADVEYGVLHVID